LTTPGTDPNSVATVALALLGAAGAQAQSPSTPASRCTGPSMPTPKRCLRGTYRVVAVAPSPSRRQPAWSGARSRYGALASKSTWC